MERTGALVRTVLALTFAACMAFQAAAAHTVTIQMAARSREPEVEWQKAVIEKFHESQDRIRVEVIAIPGSGATQRENILTMVAGGTPPHIVSGDPYTTISWGLNGVALDLTPFLERDGSQEPFNLFYPETLEMHRVEGKQFGIPLDLQVQAFFYAERAFDEAGLSYPDQSWTWRTVSEVAPRLMKRSSPDSAPDRWAMRDPQHLHWWPVIWHHGAEFVDDPKNPARFTGDTEEMRQGLYWFYHMMQELEVMPLIGQSGGSTPANLVVQQNIAMAIGNSLYQQEALKLSDQVPWNVSRLPSGPAGNTAFVNAIGWMILAGAGNHQEAWEVIKFFSGKDAMDLAVEMQGILVPYLPSTQLWMERFDKPSNRQVFVDAIPAGRPLPILYDQGEQSIRANTRAYWDGKISLEQAIENMRTEVTAWIQQIARK